MDFSEDEDLPQFTDKAPNISNLDCHQQSVEVDEFLSALDRGSGTTAPISLNLQSDLARVEELSKSFALTAKASRESLQKLRDKDKELTRAANVCKKTITQVTETRRIATEAIKKLNAETQHVLDDDIDNDALQEIESRLTDSKESTTPAFSIKSVSSINKHGFETMKKGSDVTIMSRDSKLDTENNFCVVLRRDENNRYAAVENSHEELNCLEDLLRDLNDNSDWNRFYSNLRKALDAHSAAHNGLQS